MHFSQPCSQGLTSSRLQGDWDRTLTERRTRNETAKKRSRPRFLIFVFKLKHFLGMARGCPSLQIMQSKPGAGKKTQLTPVSCFFSVYTSAEFGQIPRQVNKKL